MTQTIYHFGGQGPPLHLAVANGFPAETYTPMLRPLLAEYKAFAWLPRALWDPPPPLAEGGDWQTMADDMLAGFEREGQTGIIGVGHSMGAVATLIAAAKQPERFRALILLDPVLLKPWQLKLLWLLKQLGAISINPMTKLAKSRRSDFSSKEEAFTYWRKKKLFADWSDEVLRLYVEGLLSPRPDEKGVTLKWTPAWEAHYYEAIEVSTWRWIKQLPKDLPILSIRGSDTDAYAPQSEAKLQRLHPNASFEVMEGYGHLFPQADPQGTSQHILKWLSQ